MKILIGVLLTALSLLAAGCDDLKSARRLRLPQGSAQNGKMAFVALKCVECHSVTGVDLPKPTATPEKVVVLGGEVARMRTIGDLLTSIIHPDFTLSERMKLPDTKGPVRSPMPVVNDTMTVTQLIDLVAFLQPRYTRLPTPSDWTYSL